MHFAREEIDVDGFPLSLHAIAIPYQQGQYSKELLRSDPGDFVGSLLETQHTVHTMHSLQCTAMQRRSIKMRPEVGPSVHPFTLLIVPNSLHQDCPSVPRFRT